MKLIIARFFDTHLKFGPRRKAGDMGVQIRIQETNIAGFVVRIWVRVLKIFNRPPTKRVQCHEVR